jgi:hypothetical protein
MRIMKITYLILIVCCLLCCSNIRYTNNIGSLNETIDIVDVYIDKDFNGWDDDIIRESIEEWNVALGGRIVYRIISYKFDMEIEELRSGMRGLIILKIDSGNSMIDNGKTLAFANAIGGHWIYIIRDRIGNGLHGIMLHEIGHILGSMHVA